MTEPLTLRLSQDLTLEVLDQVAWRGHSLSLHPELLQHLAAARTRILRSLRDGRQVYGVTSGMGYLSHVQLTEDERRAHQANLLLGRAIGGPPFLDRGEARALMVARLAGFLSGHAGASPELCTFLVDRLNDDFVPAIPRTGVGCAGEIIPLAHAFGTFIGAGHVLSPSGDLQEASSALMERGVAPYEPGEKEGIALLAGAPGTLALAAARHRSCLILFRQLMVAWACAIDAIRAPLSAYDLILAHLSNDPLMETVLARLGELLRGSDVDRHGMQAPVSFRVVPQTLTHLTRVLERVKMDVSRDLNAVTDSPVFADERFITSGGFHSIGLATGLDFLCIALVQAAELAGQHIHRLLDGRFTGLPDQLTPTPGPRTGLVAVHKRVVGVLNELRRLAHPASVGLLDTSMGQEDAMTFAFESAEKLRRAETLLRDVVACELLVCHGAWSLRSSPPAAGLQMYVETLTSVVPPIDRDRPLGGDIGVLEDLLSAGTFV